jgi:hypothetical protein
MVKLTNGERLLVACCSFQSQFAVAGCMLSRCAALSGLIPPTSFDSLYSQKLGVIEQVTGNNAKSIKSQIFSPSKQRDL